MLNFLLHIRILCQVILRHSIVEFFLFNPKLNKDTIYQKSFLNCMLFHNLHWVGIVESLNGRLSKIEFIIEHFKSLFSAKFFRHFLSESFRVVPKLLLDFIFTSFKYDFGNCALVLDKLDRVFRFTRPLPTKIHNFLA